MKKIITSIISYLKNIFGNDISINFKTNKKYDIKSNKNCTIKINDNGDSNENK